MIIALLSYLILALAMGVFIYQTYNTKIRYSLTDRITISLVSGILWPLLLAMSITAVILVTAFIALMTNPPPENE